ncbi:MAG TPA: hypothetical protein VFR01_09015, partial [Geobacterales bacterium]|nr:hypothetical protein [Geobacterales bacterium]
GKDVNISEDQLREKIRANIKYHGSSIINSMGGKAAEIWQDGHSQYSDIQNPIVRIRFNERDSGGKKILFIEEMQGPSDANQKKMPEYLRKRIYDLGVKRILAYAKEQGFDGISWTPGEMQAKRYDLSKQVEEIRYRKNDDGTYDLQFIKDGRNIDQGAAQSPGDLQPAQLEQWVGKDVAAKILRNEGADTGTIYHKSLSGLDLKVGGEGLKRLYDQTLPALFKKYGKEEVRENTINKGRENYEVINLTRNESIGGGYTRAEAEARVAQNPENYRLQLLAGGNESIPFLSITDKTPGSFPQFARSGTEFNVVAKADIETKIAAPLKELRGAVPVVVVENVAGLPKPLRRAAEKVDFKAVVFKGKVYMVASKFASMDDAVTTLFDHELRHVGLQLLGVPMDKVMDEIWAGKEQASIKAFAEKLGIDTTTENGRRIAAEEYAIDLATNKPKAPLVQRIINMIRAFLRRMGVKLRTTEADILDLISRAGEAVKTGVGGMNPATQEMYARTHNPQGEADILAKFARVVSGGDPKSIREHMNTLGRSARPIFDKIFNGTIDWLAPIDRKITLAVTRPVFAPIKAQLHEYGQLVQEQAAMQDSIFGEATKLHVKATEIKKDIPAMQKTLELGRIYRLFPGKELADQPWTPQSWKEEGMQDRYGKSLGEALAELNGHYDSLASSSQVAYQNIIAELKKLRERDLKAMKSFIVDSTSEGSVERERLISQLERKYASIKGPYVPLMRHGDNVLQVFEKNEDGSKGTREQRIHFENRYDALQKRAGLQAAGYHVEISVRDAKTRDFANIPLEFMEKIKALAVSSEMSEEHLQNILSDFDDLWLEYTPDSSVLKHTIQSSDLKGYDEDMLRGV